MDSCSCLVSTRRCVRAFCFASRYLVSVLAGDDREVALYKAEVGFLAYSVGTCGVFDFTGGCWRVLVNAMFIDSDFVLCFLLNRV